MDNLRIIIVDDDPDVLQLMKMSIGHEAPSIEAATVTSAEECLGLLRSGGFDCVISDYQMPGMDGMELLTAIRSDGMAVPFIFVTGQGNEEVASEAFRRGADDYFTKEIGFAHFARITNSINKAVAHRRADTLREAAIQNLKHSEARLRQAANLAGIGVWNWDIATDNVVWSPEMFVIYGIDPAGFTGKGTDYFEYTYADDRKVQADNIAALIERAKTHFATTGERSHMEPSPRGFRLVRPDGEVRRVRGDAVVTLDESGNPASMLGILMDITDISCDTPDEITDRR